MGTSGRGKVPNSRANVQMIVDLHNHTRASFDGFSSQAEIAKACKTRGIGLVAITEHDIVSTVNTKLFERNGVEVVSGCEFTDENGAHIIGLCVNKPLDPGQPAHVILEHIKLNDGIAIMPHPWKRGSGFMSVTGDVSLLEMFDAIEIVNGGWRSGTRFSDILELVQTYGLIPLASSDSHTIDQVGMCCTKLKNYDYSISFRDNFANLKIAEIEYLIESSLLNSFEYRNPKFKSLRIYQKLLTFLPWIVRRYIKIAFYLMRNNKKVGASNFEKFGLEEIRW